MSNELKRLSRVVATIRLIDNTMPIQWVAILLEVATKEGLSISELADKTGLSLSSVSRNVMALGEKHWVKPRPGLNLLEKTTDAMDLTKKTIKLSVKGKKLVELLTEAMGG